MKVPTGLRKFLGFVLVLIFYTFVMCFAMLKISNLVLDLSVFALQASAGYSAIALLFFGSNVAEHFANRGNGNDKQN